MPRGPRRTMSGEPGQAVSAVPGQMYGEGVQQQALARQMPAPDRTATTTPSAPAPTPTEVPTVDPAAEWQAALASGQQLGGMAGLLNQPTSRPHEPITAGLRTGPGGGPTTLGVMARNPTGDLLRRLSLETGDPKWAELAARVRI